MVSGVLPEHKRWLYEANVDDQSGPILTENYQLFTDRFIPEDNNRPESWENEFAIWTFFIAVTVWGGLVFLPEVSASWSL